jgi:hypothetical protein
VSAGYAAVASSAGAQGEGEGGLPKGRGDDGKGGEEGAPKDFFVHPGKQRQKQVIEIDRGS